MSAPTILDEEGGADAGTLNELSTRLESMEFATRAFYREASRAGVTHEQMGMATGLPDSLFSMWLNQRRPLKKIEVLETLMRAAPKIEEFRLLS